MENTQEPTHEINIAPPQSNALLASMKENKVVTYLLIIALELRALALGALIASLINLPATTEKGQLKEINYSPFWVYRYMVVCAVIGIVFTMLLFNISIHQLSCGNLSSRFALYNEIMLIILSFGGAASFGFTMGLSRLPDDILNRIICTRILNSMYSQSCIYLLAFVFNFVASILARVADNIIARKPSL